MEKIAIYGAGGFGRVVGALFDHTTDVYYVFLDNAVRGDDIVGGEEMLSDKDFLYEHKIIVAIGDNAERKRLIKIVHDNNGHFALAIHKQAYSEAAFMSRATVLCAGALVGSGAGIGCGVIVSTGASVAHDSQIADYVNICDGAVLGGGVHVGEGAFIGLNATVLPKVRIGAWSIIGAGAVVNADVPPNVTVVGNPCRVSEVRVP